MTGQMRTTKDSKKRGQKKALDRKFAARVIVDATTFGDAEAARRHDISDRSVRRYRAMLETDPELAASVRKTAHRQEAGMTAERRKLIRKLMQKIEELADAATVEQLGEVVQAYKAVTEQDLAAKVLDVGGDADPQGSGAAEAPGHPSQNDPEAD